MSSDPTFWIEARASGMLAFALLTLSVIAGLVLKSRPFGTALKPATVTDTHRFLALLCLGATAIHGAALDARLDGPRSASPDCSYPASCRTARSGSGSGSSRQS